VRRAIGVNGDVAQDWVDRGGGGFGWLGLQGGDEVGVCEPGIDGDGDGDGDGVDWYGARARCSDGVDGDVAGDGVDGCGVHGHGTDGDGGRVDGGGARVRRAIGVDGGVTGDRIDGGGCGCGGVAGHGGTEAVRLVDLCCPVEPRGFVQPRVGSCAGCGMWGRVLYLALGRSCTPPFSCVHLLSPWLSFVHSPLLLYSPSPFLSLHCSSLVVLLLGRRYGVVWVRGSGSGGCGSRFVLRLGRNCG
jgi:hypothetical protein